jgi:hypothetical protein
MSLPNAAYTGGGDEDALLAKFISGPGLPISRVVKGHLYHRFFHLRFYSILGNGFAAADLSKGFFAPGVIKLLDAVKTLTARTH